MGGGAAAGAVVAVGTLATLIVVSVLVPTTTIHQLGFGFGFGFLRFPPVDGQQILASGSYDATVLIWDVADDGSGTTKQVLTHQSYVKAVAFSPTAALLATGSGDNDVRFWTANGDGNDSEIQTLPTVHTSAVAAVAFSPSGALLASASMDFTVWLWTASGDGSDTALQKLTGHTNFVYSVAFSASGALLATGSADSTVRLWTADGDQSDAVIQILTGHADTVRAVAFSPSAALLASGSEDNNITLWTADGDGSDTVIQILTGHASSVISVAFSPSGAFLASGSTDNTVRLWTADGDGSDTVIQVLIGHMNSANVVAFSTSGVLLASGSLDFNVMLWTADGDGSDTALSVLTGHTSYVYGLAFLSVCPAGYYSPSGRVPCFKCDAGYYGIGAGSTNSTCTGLCDEGYYGSADSVRTDSSCTGLCDGGYYGSADSVRTDSTCTGLCGEGYYGESDSIRTDSTCSGLCGGGYYGATAGLANSTCTGLCDAGYYGSADSVRTDSTCTGLCDGGYFGATAGLADSICTGLCDEGHYGSAESVRTDSTCTGVCDEGHYGSSDSVRTNSTCTGACDDTCETCASGGSTECDSCPDGRFLSNADGSSGSCVPCHSSCATCIYPGGDETCTACADDTEFLFTISDDTDSGSCGACVEGCSVCQDIATYCTACTEGYTLFADDATCLTSDCTDDQAGCTWCSPSGCTECNEGFYLASASNATGGFGDCTGCATGCATCDDTDICVTCASGYYFDNETQTSCSPCPADTYLNTEVGPPYDASDCSACPSDTYQPLPARTSSSACAVFLTTASDTPTALVLDANPLFDNSENDAATIRYQTIICTFGLTIGVLPVLIAATFPRLLPRSAEKKLRSIDIFNDQHDMNLHEMGDNNRVAKAARLIDWFDRPTVFGGLLTVAFFITLLSLCLALAVPYFTLNELVTTSLQPPGGAEVDVSGTLGVVVAAHGDGACASAAVSTTGTDQDFNVAITDSESTCEWTIACASCSATATEIVIALEFDMAFQEITWSAASTTGIGDESIEVSSIMKPENATLFLEGGRSSVNFFLYPSVYSNSLAGTSQSTGFWLNFFSAEVDEMEYASYDPITSGSDTHTLQLTFYVQSSIYKTTVSERQTLTQILAAAGGLFSGLKALFDYLFQKSEPKVGALSRDGCPGCTKKCKEQVEEESVAQGTDISVPWSVDNPMVTSVESEGDGVELGVFAAKKGGIGMSSASISKAEVQAAMQALEEKMMKALSNAPASPHTAYQHTMLASSAGLDSESARTTTPPLRDRKSLPF